MVFPGPNFQIISNPDPTMEKFRIGIYFFLILQNHSLSTVVYLFISNPVPNPTKEKFRIRLRKSFGSDLGKVSDPT
jgi:hypothetical protein